MKMLPFVQEAITGLGYVRPEACATVAQAMELGESRHVKEVAAALRAAEPQLSDDDKRKLRLGPDTRLSHAVWEMLTPQGRKRPIEALDATLLRANFASQRERKIVFVEQHPDHCLKAFGVVPGCEGCAEFNRREMSPDEARKALPPKNCSHEACGISLLAWKDFYVE